MKDKISGELMKIIENVGRTDYIIYKIDSSIFVRNCKDLINNETMKLYSLLKCMATDKEFKKYEDKITTLVSKYKSKLESIYNEIYCQYTTIQNELQDATLNQRAVMIAYQKVVNDSEESQSDIDRKFMLKMKNKMYKKVTNVCKKKMIVCENDFEKELKNISKEFDKYNEKKTKNKSIIRLNKEILSFIEEIENKVEEINESDIINSIREDTIDFVTKILLVKEIKVNKN